MSRPLHRCALALGALMSAVARSRGLRAVLGTALTLVAVPAAAQASPVITAPTEGQVITTEDVTIQFHDNANANADFYCGFDGADWEPCESGDVYGHLPVEVPLGPGDHQRPLEGDGHPLVSAATAKKLKLGKQKTTIGSGTAQINGARKLVIKLTSKAKSKLRKVRKLAASLTISATGAGGTTTKTQSVSLN